MLSNNINFNPLRLQSWHLQANWTDT